MAGLVMKKPGWQYNANDALTVFDNLAGYLIALKDLLAALAKVAELETKHDKLD